MELYRLTTQQQSIYDLQTYFSTYSISSLTGILMYNRQYERDHIEKAINMYIESQDGMRLQLTERDGEIFQYFMEYRYKPIPYKKFESMEEFEVFANSESRRVYQIMDTELFHFYICDIAEKSGVLIMLNHIIADAWTYSILSTKMSEYLMKIDNNEEIDICHFSYLTYIEGEADYLKSDNYIKDKNYWETFYCQKPEIAKVKPYINTAVKPTAERKTYTIDKSLRNRGRFLCLII